MFRLNYANAIPTRESREHDDKDTEDYRYTRSKEHHEAAQQRRIQRRE
jgi:hypothetical protein